MSDHDLKRIGVILDDMDGYLDYLHAFLCEVAEVQLLPEPATFEEWRQDPSKFIESEKEAHAR